MINVKKIVKYFALLMVGMSLIAYGVIERTSSKYAPEPMSDREIIERAKALGMVDLKEAWIESENGAIDEE